MNPLTELINLLKEVKEDRNIRTTPWDGKLFLERGHRTIKQIEKLGSWLLFTDRGRCDFEVHLELKRHGFAVSPIKVIHGVGWLYGIISIPGVGVVMCYNDVLLDEYDEEGDEQDEYGF
jgi:hypothetical protein